MVFLCALILASCGWVKGSTWQLPDRSEPAVPVEERIVAAAAGAPGAVYGTGATCEARLLGRTDTASYAWVVCNYQGSETSAPVRVDGDRVTVPGDGSRYAEDIEEMFPDGLADLILSSRSERLAP